MVNKRATTAFINRLTPLKRFLYPLLVVLLLALALTGFPLPVALQGWPLIAVVGLALLALTFYWFDQVGPHLHERDWRKFATELNLSFEPRTWADGEEVPARVSGKYKGRQVTLESFRSVSKRDGREAFFMHCAVSTRVSAGLSLALHSVKGNEKKKGQLPQTGDSKFDAGFRLDEVQSVSLTQTLFATLAIRKQMLNLARRPIWLRLKEGQLIYQDQRSQFFGVELSHGTLSSLFNTLCALADSLETQP